MKVKKAAAARRGIRPTKAVRHKEDGDDLSVLMAVVVDDLGGVRAVARQLALHPSVVLGWVKRKQWVDLLSVEWLAQASGVSLELFYRYLGQLNPEMARLQWETRKDASRFCIPTGQE